MAKISIEDISDAKENGIVKIWWWKDNGDANEQWMSNEEIWNIFTSYSIYKLLTDQEITINDKIVIDNFTKLT